jgi:hypothetical protein
MAIEDRHRLENTRVSSVFSPVSGSRWRTGLRAKILIAFSPLRTQ